MMEQTVHIMETARRKSRPSVYEEERAIVAGAGAAAGRGKGRREKRAGKRQANHL